MKIFYDIVFEDIVFYFNIVAFLMD